MSNRFYTASRVIRGCGSFNSNRSVPDFTGLQNKHSSRANALNICRVHVTKRPRASSSSRESTGQTHLDFIIFIFPSCAEAPFEKPSPQVGLADVTVAHVSRASRNIYPPPPTQIPALCIRKLIHVHPLCHHYSD